MPSTPDRFAGESIDEGIILEDQGPAGLNNGDPSTLGGIRRVGNRFRMLDGVGLFDPRDISHAVVEDSFDEITRTSGRITNITVWTNSGKTAKIREMSITYTSGLITQVVTQQYAEDGTTVLFTITDTINYTGNDIVSIDRVRT